MVPFDGCRVGGYISGLAKRVLTYWEKCGNVEIILIARKIAP